MTYDIEFTKKATKELKLIDAKVAKQLMGKIEELAKDPYSKELDIKKLRGINDVYRLRHGKYRVLYEVNNSKLIVTVIKVGARGEVYG